MTLFAARSLQRSIEGRLLFQDVSFDLDDGETLAVLAPSGTGKTLLLRLLAGLDPLENGEVLLDGKDPGEWGMTAWRTRVVYCAQRPAIFPDTPAQFAHEVASWSAQQSRPHDDVEQLARDWGVADAWTRQWSKLSGGEAQRAALAIAVATRPRVLLLDEPTSALDKEAREIIEARLANITSIWVTHDESQAERVADRQLRLQNPEPT